VIILVIYRPTAKQSLATECHVLRLRLPLVSAVYTFMGGGQACSTPTPNPHKYTQLQNLVEDVNFDHCGSLMCYYNTTNYHSGQSYQRGSEVVCICGGWE